MKHPLLAALAVGACASAPSPSQLDQRAAEVIRSSFRAQGIATLERLEQDATQRACSSAQPPAPGEAERIQAEALARVPWPADGRFLGDWREGEKLAQNGRGMTWTDASAAPAANGGSCYNCHQLTPREISFGTIGPSLYRYGKVRGVTDPQSAASAAVVRYTWAKLWNSSSAVACSNMPRFGERGILDAAQLRDLMALLLDPASPVNE